jgi:D-alanyl-D-alanine carboxypeptidase
MLRKSPLLLLALFLFPVLSCRHTGDRDSSRGKADSAAFHMNEKARHDSLASELNRFLLDPCFRNAIVGYEICDFSGGLPRMVFEHNALLGMTPASTQKIFVTAAALELFGESIYQEVTVTNLNSVNWRANRLLQKIGQKVCGKYDYLHGSEAVMKYWKDRGVDTKGLYLCDGSGRSHTNVASPKQLAEVLFKMTTSSVFPVFYNSLPLAGISGTMHKWLVGSCGEGRIRAKTGSLGGVRSYAGYVRTLSGKKLIFSLIINNYGCRTKVLKERVEKLMIRMVCL